MLHNFWNQRWELIASDLLWELIVSDWLWKLIASDWLWKLIASDWLWKLTASDWLWKLIVSISRSRNSLFETEGPKRSQNGAKTEQSEDAATSRDVTRGLWRHINMNRQINRRQLQPNGRLDFVWNPSDGEDLWQTWYFHSEATGKYNSCDQVTAHLARTRGRGVEVKDRNQSHMNTLQNALTTFYKRMAKSPTIIQNTARSVFGYKSNVFFIYQNLVHDFRNDGQQW